MIGMKKEMKVVCAEYYPTIMLNAYFRLSVLIFVIIIDALQGAKVIRFPDQIP